MGACRYPPVTSDDYAESMEQYLPAVKSLAAMDLVLAFNLLLGMTDASHTDVDAHPKMCGYGDGKKTFKKLDEALLPLIEQRTAPKQRADALPEVLKRWTWEDADVSEFKTGRTNKQQWNQMQRQKLEWEKERKEARRERREEAEDWVAVALSDLKEEGKHLAQYGVEGYLPQSIAKLEAVKY